jgi:hypothetical protein
MLGEEHRWATQPGPNARGEALTAMIGRTLSDAGVSPPPKYNPNPDTPLGPKTLATFFHKSWSIAINPNLVGSPSLSAKQADEVASAVYHEGRHCEQWFDMARLRAGQGYKPRDIARDVGIPDPVATSGFNAPIAAGSQEANESQVWWDSVHGPDHDRILSDLKNSERVLAAAAALVKADKGKDSHASPEKIRADKEARNKAYYEFRPAYEAYLALPEEVSARAAASKMQAALDAARKLTGGQTDDVHPTAGANDVGDSEEPALTGEGAP